MLKLKEEAAALKGIKFQLSLKVELEKTSQDGVVESTTPVLRHRQEAVFGDDEEEAVDRAIPNILELLENFTQRGSGWAVSRVKTLWLDIANYQPFKGSSYIKLPKEVENKKAVVNVKNKDENCFRWSLRAAKFPVDKDAQLTETYKIPN